MKKKILLLAIVATTLTSCSFIDIGNSKSNSGTTTSSSNLDGSSFSNSSTSSSSSNSSSSSFNNTNNLEKTNLNYTYKDYTTNSVYPVDSCPSVGTVKLLIIPIWFTDSTTYIKTAKKETVREDIKKAYTGSTSETGWHSVKTYYEEESQGKLTINATVSSWYEINKKSTYYYNDASTGTYTTKTTDLVLEAVNWYFTNNPSDSRKNYDADGNGYLDGVMLIYGAPDTQALNNESADNLWAYCYWLQDEKLKNTSNPGANTFFWASYDFMYGKTRAMTQTGTSYANGDTSHCTIDAHTFIHEMGHVFGLDDYYDYSNSKYVPAGGFSMQDYNVGGHDPYSVMALGWASPYIPTESTTITIGAFSETHDLILLSTGFNSYKSPFDEYLLLELYTPTGLNELDSKYQYGSYPTGPSTTGIRLWHVDARLTYVNSLTSVGEPIYSTSLTSNVEAGYYGVYHAMSNTYGSEEGYISPLGSSYSNYNILQLIRNNKSSSYKPSDTLSSTSLFGNGSSFNISSYSKQFVQGTKTNAGMAFNWLFKVSISGNTATIQLTKN